MLATILVIAGAVLVAALAVVFYVLKDNGIDNEALVQQLLVRREQRLAEARIQRVMQDSVAEMFKTIREGS